MSRVSDVLEPLHMSLQERMAVLSFVSKSLELLERNDLPPSNYIDLEQWRALGKLARDVLMRLDEAWPTLLPMPHDGIRWSER